jgi:hypothetical protein
VLCDIKRENNFECFKFFINVFALKKTRKNKIFNKVCLESFS